MDRSQRRSAGTGSRPSTAAGRIGDLRSLRSASNSAATAASQSVSVGTSSPSPMSRVSGGRGPSSSSLSTSSALAVVRAAGRLRRKSSSANMENSRVRDEAVKRESHRPASASVTLRKHPLLYQASQAPLPLAPQKRRYYHLGVCRETPPPDDKDQDDPSHPVRIAYHPFSSWPLVDKPGRNNSQVPPPAPKIIPSFEQNHHFVHPSGALSSDAGTDFSGHFVNRPNYSFQLQDNVRPASASAAATDMRKELWRVQRDAAALWEPSHRGHSAVSMTTSTAIARHEDALFDDSLDWGEDGSYRPATAPQRTSMEVVRSASASHATRMIRLERKLRNTSMPLSHREQQLDRHPNQVFVHL